MKLDELTRMASALLREWNLKGWTFSIDTGMLTRLGYCNYDTKVISVTDWHAQLNSDHEVIDTLKHEIAHALAGDQAGHGPQWRLWCKRVGCRPRQTRLTNELIVIKRLWRAVCLSCGAQHQFTKQPEGHRLSYACKCQALKSPSTRVELKFKYVGLVVVKPRGHQNETERAAS